MRTEDGKIIEKCLNGEPEAFGLLADKYKASIFAIVYSKVQNFHDAQDIAQDVFLEAYRDLRKLRHWDSFVWWLYSIAYNDCKNWFRDQSKRPDSSFIEDQEQEKLESPSIDAYHEDLINESLRDTLDSLPEKYREVLTLYYLGGMDSEEIARVIGVSPTAVRQRLSRARIQLKEEVLGMISETFSQQRLPVTFTFRIVEAVKRIKINPISTIKNLPWGLSLATGIIITVLSLNPYVSWFSQIGDYARSVLPSETKVLKIGEIPVDIVKTSNISILSSNMGKGKGGEPKQPNENAFFMAPQGEGGTWVKKVDMPNPRGGLSSCMVNGKIYAIGGMQAEGVAVATMDEYDPATNKWTKKADMATLRVHFSANTVNGKIYAIGGGNLAGPLASVEEYDPIADKWTKKADMPTPRSNFSSSVVDGKIYAIGGRNNNGHVPAVEEYDPALDKWTKKSNMSKARSYFTACALNGKIYAMGGWIPNEQFATVEEYDPIADKWTKKADMPITDSAFAVCALNEKIYVFGGETPDGINPISTVVEYDPITDKWTKMPDMPIARAFTSASVVNGKAYIMGGSKDSTTVFEYTPESLTPGSISPKGKSPGLWGSLKSK